MLRGFKLNNGKYCKMTRQEFEKKASKIYGDDRMNWMFICPWCKFKQSMNSILESIKRNGFHFSQRYGEITMKNIKKLQPRIDQECLSGHCNYVSYGLICGLLEVEGHNYLELAPIESNRNNE